MKRPPVDDEPESLKQPRAETVRLNVGGRTALLLCPALLCGLRCAHIVGIKIKLQALRDDAFNVVYAAVFRFAPGESHGLRAGRRGPLLRG